jgi:hypothetical protein
VRQCLAPPFRLAESQSRREPARLYKATGRRLPPISSTCCSILPSPPRRRSVADRSAELTWSMGQEAMSDGDEVEAIAPSHLSSMDFSGNCHAHSTTHGTGPSRKLSNIRYLRPTMVLPILIGTSGNVAAGTHMPQHKRSALRNRLVCVCCSSVNVSSSADARLCSWSARSSCTIPREDFLRVAESLGAAHEMLVRRCGRRY